MAHNGPRCGILGTPSECEPEQWSEGEYEIRMFLGTEWKTSARFRVISSAQTPSQTVTSESP